MKTWQKWALGIFALACLSELGKHQSADATSKNTDEMQVDTSVAEVPQQPLSNQIRMMMEQNVALGTHLAGTNCSTYISNGSRRNYFWNKDGQKMTYRDYGFATVGSLRRNDVNRNYIMKMRFVSQPFVGSKPQREVVSWDDCELTPDMVAIDIHAPSQ